MGLPDCSRIQALTHPQKLLSMLTSLVSACSALEPPERRAEEEVLEPGGRAAAGRRGNRSPACFSVSLTTNWGHAEAPQCSPPSPSPCGACEEHVERLSPGPFVRQLTDCCP